MPTHGEYRAGSGFYDSGLGAWIKDPAKLTEVISARETTASDRDTVAGWGTRPFKENPELEGLIRLRDSSRPEDRAAYERMAAGSKRMTIASYENSKAEAQ